MPNSTKTWQERFDDIFGENHHKICIGKNCECHKVVKQFISDLRKKDEEELIRMIDSTHTIGEIREALIDYYTN